MGVNTISVGGASGYWGDAAMATPQLLSAEKLDYLVYDYLAEITMSIMARARAADETKGYATDFVSAAMGPNLETIARRGVKVIANAGGVNPQACADALRAEIAGRELGLSVAVVTGDDLTARAAEFSEATEMFSGERFPDPETIASINAYLGAFPIADALGRGADIVITGRCVDSAVTLGACIHAFGWSPEDLDRLAQGSLAGHILECGTQATGGNFTDWESVVDTLDNAGYPIAEIAADGSFEVGKPAATGGAVSIGTVSEQMLYEIGDPRSYVLPDVVCDFSEVTLEQVDTERVRVSGARGRGVPDSYKASVTWADGFRAGHIWTMVGRDAEVKAQRFAQGCFDRTARVLEAAGLPPLSETCVEVVGCESHYGAARRAGDVREVDVKIAVKHPSAAGVGIFLKEMTGLALAAPAGLCGFAGARARPSPVVRLFSMLVSKGALSIAVSVEGETSEFRDHAGTAVEPARPHEAPAPAEDGEMVAVPLERLAWGRSGDKGRDANIGIIARQPDYVPYIARAMTADRVADCFAHFLAPGAAVERFYLPGPHAFNFLLQDVLGGGGVASLRTDPQGKGYAQLLLSEEVAIPASLAHLHQLA